jgi:hypothetical protein
MHWKPKTPSLHAKITFALALAITAATSAVALARCLRPPPGSERASKYLQVNPVEWNLGDIDQTEALEHALTINNVGGERLVVARIHRSCDCVEVGKLEGEALAPGESKTMKLRMKVRLSGKVEVGARQPFNTVIAVEYQTDSGARLTAEWTLEAKVRPVFRASAATLDFGTVSHYAVGVKRGLNVFTSMDIESIKADISSGSCHPGGFHEGGRSRGRGLL